MSPPADVQRTAARLARPIPDAPQPKVRCVCEWAQAQCADVESKRGWICTRPRGHKGKHVACSKGDIGDHRLAEWPQRKGRAKRDE